MNNLFAPWRMEVLEAYDTKSSCILCDLYESKDDREALVISRSEKSYVVMNKFPYGHAHLMIVPNRHIGSWTDLKTEEMLEVMQTSQQAVKVLTELYHPQGFNLGVNLGRAAGAGIADHVHWHLVPRWAGDTNFMPLLAEVKVVSEHLEATYDRLRSHWTKVK